MLLPAQSLLWRWSVCLGVTPSLLMGGASLSSTELLPSTAGRGRKPGGKGRKTLFGLFSSSHTPLAGFLGAIMGMGDPQWSPIMICTGQSTGHCAPYPNSALQVTLSLLPHFTGWGHIRDGARASLCVFSFPPCCPPWPGQGQADL